MGYIVESPNPFAQTKGQKIMSVDRWDESCCDEINTNANMYSLIQFHRDVPKGMLGGIRCKNPINVSVVGKAIADISGLQECRPGISSLIIGLIQRKAIERAPLSDIVGLESIRIAFLDGIQLNGIHGSPLKKLIIEEVGGLKVPLDLSGLACLEHLRIMKLGTTPGILLTESSRIRHIAICDGKSMRKISLPIRMRPIEYISLEKVPLIIAEQLAQYSPLRVELESKDIFKTREEARGVFPVSEILFG